MLSDFDRFFFYYSIIFIVLMSFKIMLCVSSVFFMSVLISCPFVVFKAEVKEAPN